MAKRIRIVIVEDQPFVRTSLALLLNSQPDFEVVGEAEDGEAAVQKTRECRPDVVVMDCVLPKLAGPEAARRVMQELSEVCVIGHSWRDEDELVRSMLEAGASAFVSKAANVFELVDTIRRVAGASPLPPPGDA